MSDRRVSLVRLAIAGWLLAIGYGASRLIVYTLTPGPQASTSASWPEHSVLPRSRQQPAILAFIHPGCPCSAATLRELERLAAGAGSHARGSILLWTHPALPATPPPHIPGFTVVEDREGRIARSFGVRTSGQVLLYARDGALVFRGGITPGRGHSGDNPGSDALQGLLMGETPAIRSFPVFGCSLYAD
jgi:hypothetical protein